MMNKLEIINELRRCVERRNEHVWDVWYKGEYLGEIARVSNMNNQYVCIRENCNDFLGRRENFMAAISSFVPNAIKVKTEKATVAMREAMNNTPDLKQIGIREPKTIWQKIKGWFK
ncbi:hypothetical protein [Kosakonia phage Kc304]|nr:hypothetical protein [Kosakonia phage Kc304]